MTVRQPTKFKFHVDKALNLFCHTICLFPESYRSEGSAFNNPPYRASHAQMRQKPLVDLFSKLLALGWADWDFVGLSVIGGDIAASPLEKTVGEGFGRLACLWSEILTESWKGYSEIWPEAQRRLDQYATKFGDEWEPIGEGVLRRIREISETSWNPERVNVYLVDCLNGGASFADTVLLAPARNLETEKKLLAHELSESAFSAGGLRARLETMGADPSLVHTIVDTTAYIAVKASLKRDQAERLEPNPNYYAKTKQVYSAFEKSGATSGTYQGFNRLLAAVFSELAAPDEGCT